MNLAAALAGLVLLLMGYGYLFRPDKLYRINAWLRENALSDRIILMHRRKIGALLLLIGVIVLTLSFK